MVEAFSEEHLDGAAALLADRHRRHCQAEPLLTPQLDFRGLIEAEWRRERASGVVAVRGSEIIAYLIGRRDEHPQRGPYTFVGAAGHAAAEAEVVRDLYAALAADWVDAGTMRHNVVVPASDGDLLDAWWRLSFGQQHAYAIRETAEETVEATSITIRSRSPEDIPAPLAIALFEHQRQSPTFSGAAAPSVDRLRAWWREEFAESTHFVAERDGRPVGHLVLSVRAPERRSFVWPEDSIDLSHAATLPEARGSGVMSALTAHALSWTHREGYRSMTTDWLAPNLLSSRFWPRRGFRTTFLRLYRHIP